MSPQMQEQLAQMAAQLQALMQANGGAAAVPPAAPGMVPPGAMPGAAAFGANPWAAPASVPPPLGWSVAVEFPVMGAQGMGTVNVDVSFPAETFAQAPQIIQAMLAQGWKIYVRMPKPAFNGNGGGYPPRAYPPRAFGGYPPRY